MAYPGQQYNMNQQNYYAPPQRPPPGQGQFYAPPFAPPPPNMAARPIYHPNAPNVHQNNYNQGQFHPPPPPPQASQMFNQQVGQQYTFQYSQCTGKRKVSSSDMHTLTDRRC